MTYIEKRSMEVYHSIENKIENKYSSSEDPRFEETGKIINLINMKCYEKHFMRNAIIFFDFNQPHLRGDIFKHLSTALCTIKEYQKNFTLGTYTEEQMFQDLEQTLQISFQNKDLTINRTNNLKVETKHVNVKDKTILEQFKLDFKDKTEDPFYKNTIKIIEDNPNITLSLNKDTKSSNIGWKYKLICKDPTKWITVRIGKGYEIENYDEISDEEYINLSIVFDDFNIKGPIAGYPNHFIRFTSSQFTIDKQNELIDKYGIRLKPILDKIHIYFQLQKAVDDFFDIFGDK